MYIAICKVDDEGRQILVGWEPYKMQEIMEHPPNEPDLFYSNLITDIKTDPDSGTYIVKPDGTLDKLSDYSTGTTAESNLPHEQEKKISLINQMFEALTRQVIPADYIAYVMLSSNKADVDADELYDWFMEVNEYRRTLIQSIMDVEQVEDLSNITIDLSGYDSERPNLLFETTTIDGYDFEKSRLVEAQGEISIPSNGSISIYLETDSIPFNGRVIMGASEVLDGVSTNYAEESETISPLSILFRLKDGSALSANDILYNSVELPDGLSHIEFTITQGLMLRTINVALESMYSECTVETICDKLTQKGNKILFDIDCMTDRGQIYVNDSSFIGPLSIVASKISPEEKVDSIKLVDGILSIDLHEYTTAYEVKDDTGSVVYNGMGPGSSGDLSVGDNYTLDLIFTNTTTVEIADWSLMPTISTISTYEVGLQYNKLTASLSIKNNNALDLTGRLIFELI